MNSSISRRTFVKDSAAAIGVASIGSTGFGSQVSSEIRCGVIGTGGRGRNAHIKSIFNVPGARVVAICDISQDAINQALAMFSGKKPKTYTYHREMLEQESLDAVFVATPPVPHRAHVVETLQKGCHCYVEKPLALTVSDVEEIEAEAKKAKGILQVGQQFRYSPRTQKVIQMLRAGEIGRIGFVRAQRFNRWGGPGSGEQRMRWLWSVEESGDQLVENSIHNIDQINWALDGHPVKCAALGGQNMLFEPKGRDISDNYGLVFRYAENIQVTFSTTRYATFDTDGIFTHLYGEKGACDLTGGRFIGRERGAEPRLVEAPEVDMTQACIDAFFRCIREGKEPFCNAEVGKIAVLTTLLGRKAFFEERVVTWEDLLREDAPVKRFSDRASSLKS